MKSSFYFSHDYNARNDEKIKRLLRTHGLLGYGLFWSIVEELYNNTNVLRTDYDGIAFEMRTTPELVKSVINDFNLFVIDGEFFGSRSIEERLNERLNKSARAKESVNKRWEKYRVQKESNTNVLQTKNDSNTIKERKGKESKEKDINTRKNEFCDTLKSFKELYPSTLLTEFYEYWTEAKPGGKKMRFEMEKVFDVSRRLKTWAKNQKNFAPQQLQTSAPQLPYLKPKQ